MTRTSGPPSLGQNAGSPTASGGRLTTRFATTFAIHATRRGRLVKFRRYEEKRPKAASDEYIEFRPLGWNDWWTYKTLHYLYYVDAEGNRHDIGAVKIADLATKYTKDKLSGGVQTPLEDDFAALPDSFVSVGQDESYYANLLDKLGVKRTGEVLRALNDFTAKPDLFESKRSVPVVYESLMRNVPASSLTGVYRRIIRGATEPPSYDFAYRRPNGTHELPSPDLELSFAVVPNSKPPTNVHVLIGRNGSGKTTLLRSMVKAMLGPKIASSKDGQFVSADGGRPNIANLVYVAFSAFDEVDVPVRDSQLDYDIAYSYVGLHYTGSKTENTLNPEQPEKLNANKKTRPPDELGGEFATSAWKVLSEKSRELWKECLDNLESDPNFAEAEVSRLAEFDLDEAHLRREAVSLFANLSSGHKIVLLTVTRLVQTVTERTLVFLDEPEGHLHPPLLSAFIRTLSSLMQKRNGIAIIATHSPVILQEVPRSCVRSLRRTGSIQFADELPRETFGENVGTLTNGVFGLEVTASGFHRMVTEAYLELGDYEAVLDRFGDELGFEARAVLRSIDANANKKR